MRTRRWVSPCQILLAYFHGFALLFCCRLDRRWFLRWPTFSPVWKCGATQLWLAACWAHACAIRCSSSSWSWAVHPTDPSSKASGRWMPRWVSLKLFSNWAFKDSISTFRSASSNLLVIFVCSSCFDWIPTTLIFVFGFSESKSNVPGSYRGRSFVRGQQQPVVWRRQDLLQRDGRHQPRSFDLLCWKPDARPRHSVNAFGPQSPAGHPVGVSRSRSAG